ncbi:ABC transporter permease [Phaeovibrio sulfidiphilus]|uniref:ABC transporter permease n=1 Tax=Phaeovibrio sulfidiphilus TaxID=1220600 RepID=A0A8J6YNZ8_9PROT|nr:ABC transporter permease [Phaeovibrio sulfidiphilus]MBE1237299.1 ABC transporter permease [Phaeovibrio sulfidiphilus]
MTDRLVSTVLPLKSPSGGPALSGDRPAPGGDFAVERAEGAVRLRLTGLWVTETLAGLAERFLQEAGAIQSAAVSLDLTGVTRLDTAGALVINQALARLGAGRCRTEVVSPDEEFIRLLNTAKPVPEGDRPGPQAPAPVRFVNQVGRNLTDVGRSSLGMLSFLGEFLGTLGYLAVRPGEIRWTSLAFHMDQAGIRAIPIVSLLSFLIGMVVAYMGMNELAKFGAQFFSIKMLEVTILREMGVILAAVLVAGRSASSFTAQIGSMVANEEVSAIRALGLSPMVLLVVPRIVALVLTFPLLVFIADVVGVIGGGTAICLTSDISVENFITQFNNGAKTNNFLVGLIKAPFCALAIGLVGCYHGFQASTSAESVGFLTTASVVKAIFLVIVIDAIFAIFFVNIGL